MKARIPKGYGSSGANNLQQLAKQAQKMQDKIADATEKLEEKEYSSSVGGGAVSVTANGKMEIKSIEIKPEVVDPDDIEMLSDLIMGAVNEALRSATEDKDTTLESISGGMNMPGLF